MSLGKIVRRVLTVLLAILLLSLLLGNVLGQPIFLSYVETGSMEPSLAPGDGYVTTPTAISGPIEQGDVVVFRAEELQGGGLVTHRVVDETSRGFVTKGDANPFTDQDNVEPPVKREQIVAVAVQIDGNLLVIPGLGTVVEGIQGSIGWIQTRLAILLGTGAVLGTQGLAYIFAGLTAVLYLVDVWMSGDRQRRRSRKRDSGINARLVIGLMALAIVLAATATMVAPSGPQEVQIVSSTVDSERSDVVKQGTNGTISLFVGNGGYVPVYTFYETGSANLAIHPDKLRIGAQSSENATITVSAPPETGAYRYYFTEHRYLAILPESHLQRLYSVHPWLPIIVIDVILGVPFYVIGILLVGTGRVRRRSRDGPGTLQRIQARLK